MSAHCCWTCIEKRPFQHHPSYSVPPGAIASSLCAHPFCDGRRPGTPRRLSCGCRSWSSGPGSEPITAGGVARPPPAAAAGWAVTCPAAGRSGRGRRGREGCFTGQEAARHDGPAAAVIGSSAASHAGPGSPPAVAEIATSGVGPLSRTCETGHATGRRGGGSSHAGDRAVLWRGRCLCGRWRQQRSAGS